MNFTLLNVHTVIRKINRTRCYSMCCPPQQSGGTRQAPGSSEKIVPPTDCRPGPISPNPCFPRNHHGKNTHKKYRNITFFVLFPLIIIQTLHTMEHKPQQKGPCRNYEYMRLRTKRFPWGDGNKSLFHNDNVNHLPGECESPPLDCD